MHKKVTILSIIALFVGAIFYINPWGVFSEKTQAHVPGARASMITATDLSGRQVNIDFQNKITVINFWATWCPPCRGEMPELNSFALENSEKIAFYAVNLQEQSDKVETFLRENSYTMPVVIDTSGETAKDYRVSAIPTTIIVDKEGVIKFKKVGIVTKVELDTAISGLQ